MSLLASHQSSGLRPLTDSVSELLSRVGEEILATLASRAGEARRRSVGGSGRLVRLLRPLLTDGMASAAGLVVQLLEREVEEYRRLLERQNRLLEAALSPVVLLKRTGSSAKDMTTDDENRPLHSDAAIAASSGISAAESDEEWIENFSDEKDTAQNSADKRDEPVINQCLICGKTFCHKGNLIRHAEMHADFPENLCGVCGKHLEGSGDLSDHLASHRKTVWTSRFCEICGKRFQNMETHILSHTGVKPYSCDFCSKSFPRASALKRHKKVHSREKPNTCQICGKTYAENQMLLEHLKTHEDHRKGENDSSDMANPEVNVEPLPDDSLCCRVCGDSFHSRGFLRKHAATHSSDSRCVCGVCGEQLDSSDVLQTHLESHREGGGTCSVCGKSFQNMETHMRIHTGLKPYQCPVCGKRFPRPGALTRHRKTHSAKHPLGREQEVHNTESQNAEMPVSPPYSCKVCGESFQGNGNLRKHARRHASQSVCGVCGEDLLPSETLADHLKGHKDKGKVCHICGNTFQHIETHMRTHTGIKPYSCSICGKCFPRRGHLRRHKKNHSGERPYICEICGKTYTEHTSLTTHIRSHNSNRTVSRVNCDTCGKSFASVQILQVHRRIHTGEKPFPCRICGKAFRQVGGLNLHMVTHTGVKPFRCTLCGKSFSTKGYLETHTRFHRKELAFGCHLCSKAFVTKTDLKKHLLTHTGEKPYSCQVCGKSYQEKRSRDVHMKVHRVVHNSRESTWQEDLQTDFIQL